MLATLLAAQLEETNNLKIGKVMTWENYGEWHIDHKIPVSAFNFDHIAQGDFKCCWALENLQPLWARDNRTKGSKVQKHFQPMLN